MRARRSGLEVLLTDPDVPIDTDHLERALRAIPMGRKNCVNMNAVTLLSLLLESCMCGAE